MDKTVRRPRLHHMARAAFVAVTGISAVALAPADALAAYPEKPVRIVVPYATGGGIDVVARLVADALGKMWGQGVVIENRPGGGSIVGTDVVAKSAPDGYTLLTISNSMALTVASGKPLPYDVVRDLAPITLTARAPFVLAVSGRLNIDNVGALIALGKTRPGGLNFASAGTGTMTHMAIELFKARTGVPTVHIPYKGSNPAMADLIDGRTDGLFASPAAMKAHTKDGGLRIIAVTTRARAAGEPNLPTMIEAGVPDFDVSTWFGLMAPAGTPPAVLDRIYTDVRKVLASPDAVSRMDKQGLEPVTMPPAQFSELVRREIATWTKIVKDAGIKLD